MLTSLSGIPKFFNFFPSLFLKNILNQENLVCVETKDIKKEQHHEKILYFFVDLHK